MDILDKLNLFWFILPSSKEHKMNTEMNTLAVTYTNLREKYSANTAHPFS